MTLVELDHSHHEEVKENSSSSSSSSSQPEPKRRRVWPLPPRYGAPSSSSSSSEPNLIPPSSPSPSEDPVFDEPQPQPDEPSSIPNQQLALSIPPSSFVQRGVVGFSAGLSEKKYTPGKLNPFRRVFFEQRHQRSLVIQDVYNSSDDEDEDEICAERALMNRYGHRRYGLHVPEGEEEEPLTPEGEDDGSDQTRIMPRNERKEALQTKIEEFHARCGHDIDKVIRERERYWIMRDIGRKWCFICSMKHKNRAGDRFKEIEQVEHYWYYNLLRMSMEKTIDAIHVYHLTECRPYYTKRTIDPYTGKPKPKHWWSTVAIEEHFMKHDPKPFTFHVLQLHRNMELLATCEDYMQQRDESTGKIMFDHRAFLQRTQLTKEIDELWTKIHKYQEQSNANHSMNAAMNSAST